MCLQYDVIASVVNANETANDNVDKDSARYAGLLLAPAECFGLGPRLFLPFGKKKSLLCGFGPLLVSSSNLGKSRFIGPCKSWTDGRFAITQFVTPNTHVFRHLGV